MFAFLKKPIGMFIAIIVAGGVIGFVVWSNRDVEPSYDAVVVKRKTLTQEVNVSGKVKSAESVDLSFEKTGILARLLADVGERVQAGQILAELDAQDAQKTVRKAEVALETARVALEKIKLEQRQQLRGDTLNKNYEDGLVILGTMYDQFDTMLEDLDDIFFGTEISGPGQENIVYYTNSTKQYSVSPRLEMLYRETEQLYKSSLALYLAAERGGGEVRLEAIESGYGLVVKAAETIKTGRDAIRFFEDTILSDTTVHIKQSTIDAHGEDLSSYAASTDSYAGDLLAIVNSINNQIDSVENYPLDINSQELTILQGENDLQDAREDLEKYTLRSPIDAVVTKNDITIGESVTANSPVITVISGAEFELEVNIPEVDIGRVRVGNKAAITLDAYGRDEVFFAAVTEIDPAETVISGITTYRAILQFAESDERLKPGMTADITIATASKDSVIAVPQRAIIRQDDNRFVRVVRDGAIEQVPVETGLQGSDGTIEIVSGIFEGDEVITFFPE